MGKSLTPLMLKSQQKSEKSQPSTPISRRLARLVAGSSLIALLLAHSPIHATQAHPRRAHPRPPGHWVSLGIVHVTGYDDYGSTATGTQAGPGQCAVNPTWVAYGSRLRVQGVGTCLATDTGAFGARWIDVWEPSAALCYAITGYRQAWLWVR